MLDRTTLNPNQAKEYGGSGTGGGDDHGQHPFIQGLLRKLPEPETAWKDEERVKWLDAAVRIFDLMYSGGEGSVSISTKKET